MKLKWQVEDLFWVVEDRVFSSCAFPPPSFWLSTIERRTFLAVLGRTGFRHRLASRGSRLDESINLR